MPPHSLHVVSHTHWDREWYLTFQQFRLRLVDLVDHVLDILESDETFRHFNLDAQTIVLEDYLQIRPHARERIERLVRAGRLGIGPWYQLNDQFLTSGEATVRSLLVGHRIARSFGACQKIGYLPDQFGNLSQMPQIFRGFGIDNAVVGRGYQLVGDRKMEFWWEGPDGSRVLGSLLAFWYNNAQRIPSEPDEAARFFERLRDKMGAVSHSRHLLLMNGVDHLEAQPDAGAIIAAHGGEPDVMHSSLPQYIDAIREGLADAPLEVKQGELREDRGGSCLAGVLSTRMYLKQANHRCQVLLEHYAERLSAFALIAGTPYPYDQLLYAWKLLMQNHPHDSICGCSVDQVHREMMTRFAQVEQVGEELTIRALNALCGRDTTCGARREETAIRVFNTLNWARTDPVIMTLEFPLGEPTRGNPPRDDSRMVRGFRILDSEGAEVPFAVTRNTAAIRQVLNPRELNLDQWVQQVDIEFIAQDVPACGYRTYSIERTDNFPAYPVVSERFETRGPNFMATPMFEDVGEVGDEYLHRKPLTDTRIRLDLRTARMGYHPSWESQNNAVRQRIVDQQQLALPESSDLDRRSDHRVECPIAVTSTIWQGVPRVEFRIDMENRARDHRLRALWTAGAPDSVVAEAAFDAVERPVVHPLETEGALPFHPQ